MYCSNRSVALMLLHLEVEEAPIMPYIY